MPIKYDIDEQLRHQQYIERLASGGINSVVKPSLDATYKSIARILNEFDENPTQAQLNRIVRAINKAIEDNNGWTELTTDYLNPLADYEAQWQAAYQTAAGVAAITVPDSDDIQRYMKTAMMELTSGQNVSVAPWGDYTTTNVDSRKRYINSAVRTGFNSGQSISQIKKSVKNVVGGIIAREAETLARTGYIHYANQAKKAMVEDNKDILNELVYLSVWDNKTSLICLGLSGKRWSVTAKNIPWPPNHFNCRSTMLSVVKGAQLTGTQSAVGGVKGAEARELYDERKERLRVKSKVGYRGKKDTDIFKPGQVSAKKSHEVWLEEQPMWFIESTLGKARAELLVKGNLKLSQFTDMSNRILTLDELKILDKKAFDMAGL